MIYQLEIKPSCQEAVKKLCKKNKLLEIILQKKIKEILQNPNHYKPLKYGLAGKRRVHIMKSFVLRFEIDETNKIIILIYFGHHDEAYKI
jgi:YafQ family addiction module toxin component